jgi:hypothetical protein
MKKLLYLLLVISACSGTHEDEREALSLAGEWNFRIDSLDRGIEEKWYLVIGEETVKLPGSMAENGKGEEVTLKTDWTGDIIDRSYFTEEKYSRYREPGNIKIPFWLKPVKYYKGPAWYQKEFDLPAGWKDKEITLYLERPHWESVVFVNGKPAGIENSLAVPHLFNITGLVAEGKNLISIRIDNRVKIPVGVNSHSISDHTQSNWNGIAGDISLRATSKVSIEDIAIYPDIKKKSVKVIVGVSNRTGDAFEGKISIQAEAFNTLNALKHRKVSIHASVASEKAQLVIDYPMGEKMLEWNEFEPSMYNLAVVLKNADNEVIDRKYEDFGMREFKTSGTRFELNNRPVFLRGTTECCIFPLTGYPPTDRESWEKVLKTCKDYGLNHMRFHSYCPPEAAFEAADRLGIFFHVECSSWANQGTSIGDGKSVDKFIYEEGDRIIKEYGNHPSFCMMAYGNEPAGRNQKEFLGKLLKYWKAKDNRRVYTSAAGWPVIPENDYNLLPDPRIQHWGEGLKSIINRDAPQTEFDYDSIISKYRIPVVSHEIGQWCVYPDFKEIEKYTGVLKATNFEIFRETLDENGMGTQAEDFLMASGKLQSLCYKAEIEAALRTPGFAGFQLLQLHDFPGQGTALVGILNSFFESKGYITPEEFTMFCNSTVPLARMPKFIYSNHELIRADIEISHFGLKPLTNATVACKILNADGDSVFSKQFHFAEIPVANCISIGSMEFDPTGIKEPQKLKLVVEIQNTPFKNSWDIWVYPDSKELKNDKILITDNFDKNAESVLNKGGSVLLLNYGRIAGSKGGDVAIGFSSIFWNTAWTNNQAPHTLGILCDPAHPVFKDFPTEYHSNWQWWDPVMHSQVMMLNDFPEVKPLIQPIDTWFENRKLGLAFEAKSGGGKIFVCSIDLKNISVDRLASKQLLKSILGYMESNSFNPDNEINIGKIRNLARQVFN